MSKLRKLGMYMEIEDLPFYGYESEIIMVEKNKSEYCGPESLEAKGQMLVHRTLFNYTQKYYKLKYGVWELASIRYCKNNKDYSFAYKNYEGQIFDLRIVKG